MSPSSSITFSSRSSVSVRSNSSESVVRSRDRGVSSRRFSRSQSPHRRSRDVSPVRSYRRSSDKDKHAKKDGRSGDRHNSKDRSESRRLHHSRDRYGSRERRYRERDSRKERKRSDSEEGEYVEHKHKDSEKERYRSRDKSRHIRSEKEHEIHSKEEDTPKKGDCRNTDIDSQNSKKVKANESYAGVNDSKYNHGPRTDSINPGKIISSVENSDDSSGGSKSSSNIELADETPHHEQSSLFDFNGDETEQLNETMGFSGFDTTKQKRVISCDIGAISVHKQNNYRQYMNRKRGFNRNLSPT